jgi:hypothetical protein
MKLSNNKNITLHTLMYFIIDERNKIMKRDYILSIYIFVNIFEVN